MSLLTPRARILFLIHHLGFPRDATRWRNWSDEHRLLLVEDVAQAWLSIRGGTPTGGRSAGGASALVVCAGLRDGRTASSAGPTRSP